MTMIPFPQTIFTTQHQFNDYAADDMRYGDLSEAQLKRELRLTHIANSVDPYTLTRLTAFDTPQSRFAGVYGHSRDGGQVSVQECARLLFNEMQMTSLPFACVGPYKYLINKMLRHFRQSSGMPFSDMQLNAAYKEQILTDNTKKSTKLAIQQTLNDYVDYKNKGFRQADLNAFAVSIRDKILPKFDSLIMDKINGMGITIHDIYATRIDIQSLEVSGTRWRAKVKFMGQDHFGLDIDDIRKLKFRQFQFFKIWFILQRFNRFGFRPFLTNLETVIDLEGSRQ